MIIETKFEIGEKVVLIDSNQIITLPVQDIEYVRGNIKYSFCKSKGLTMMDRDIIIDRYENQCFKSIKELSEYYESNPSKY